MQSSPISYCKIFPPIGIARLGDSKDEENGYFIGPEWENELPHKKESFSFRDGSGRIKRQVARFRIYAFDDQGNVIGELTSNEATITWKAQLANKKAAWFEFQGTEKALDSFTGKRNPDDRIRNRGIGRLIKDPEAPVGAKYKSDDKRAQMLEIVSDELRICGPSVKSDPNDRNRQYKFVGKFKQTRPVYLGELRTDECGRLMVFGGHGVSDAIDENGSSIRSMRWIQNYANNDDWFDDTSDGYVKAEVVLKDNNKPIEVRGAAWVIVAPPDFAPDTKNLVTLFDVLEEVVHDNAKLRRPEVPTPRGVDAVIYDEDIKPILQRLLAYRWVNETALRGHGYRKAGDFRARLETDLRDKSSTEGAKLRENILGLIRIPTYSRPAIGGSSEERNIDTETKVKQASMSYMPPLSGDEGDRTTGDPSTWFTVTHLQYARLEAWSKGKFSWVGAPADARVQSPVANESQSVQDLPFRLARTVLEQCVGGAFFPGIEITAIARHPQLYREAYRFDDEVLTPGDITKHMALPWQADFFECRLDWWPAQRPDDIVTDEDFEEIFASFEEETVGDPASFESVLFSRKRWDRGLGRSRPSRDFLRSQLLPEPRNDEGNIDEFIKGRTRLIASLLLPPNFLLPSNEGSKYAERLPAPWRIQYLAQERLDQYAGRYFHLRAPAPEAIFKDPRQGDESRNNKARVLPMPASELRGAWPRFRVSYADDAGSIVDEYIKAVSDSISEQVMSVFSEHPAPRDSLKQYYDAIKADFKVDFGSSVAEIEADHPEDFTTDSEPFKRLRLVNMLTIIMDMLYVRHSQQSGDMDMVDHWNSLGFVVERKKKIKDRAGKDHEIVVHVETDRSRYDGLSFRDYFYFLMNIEKFPDFVSYAKVLAERFLKEAEDFIERKELQDPDHPESFVEYNETNFEVKLEQIYEILRAQANGVRANSPWLLERTRADLSKGILSNAAFNQTDGSWLRNISRAGTSDEVHGLLFDIWSDEIGNGDPSLHHGNLYTALLQQLGYFLPEVNSRAYADHPGLSDRRLVGAVLPLAISQHSAGFFPEILGMTLFLEWEVLSLVPGVKRSDYFGINSHFFRMHVGIDNATEGHGYAAKRAVQLYLDHILHDSGPDAVRKHWWRIWRGFVAFALGGSGIFSNENGQSDDDIAQRYPGTPADRIEEMMRRKRRYGNLQHGTKQIGGFRINDLFDEPNLFMEQLAHSPRVEPGDPDRSPLLNLLTEFQGPMYKVFDKEDLESWREWIIWLGKECDTPAPKRYIGKGEAMLLLLTELREQAMSEQAHTRYKLMLAHTGRDSRRGAGRTRSVADWFSEPDLKKLMRALADPANGWVVPGRPEESPLVVDLAGGGRRMGKVLDQRFPTIGNEIGRLVIVRWILAGCPIPGGEPPQRNQCGSVKTEKIRQLIVQEYGMGAVH